MKQITNEIKSDNENDINKNDTSWMEEEEIFKVPDIYKKNYN
jgi:hypothetical protein